MDEKAKAAYIISQSACAMIAMQGMVAANKERELKGEVIPYDEKAFMDLMGEYGLHHNTVVGYLNGY
jgi:hypothetical protein